MVWSKEFPKADGFYWWRRSSDKVEVIEIADAHAYRTGGEFFVTANGGEFLGPLSPEQAEQFDALRKAASDALTYLEDTGESCRTSDLIAALRSALGKQE